MFSLLNDIAARITDTVGQRLIKLDPDAATALVPIQGKVLRLVVTSATGKDALTFYVIPQLDCLSVINEFDGDVDVTLKGSPFQFLSVLRQGGNVIAVRESGIVIDGNTDVLEQFSHAVDGLDIDPEELLSRWIGDTPARKLSVFFQQARAQVDKHTQAFTEDTGYWLREDSNLLITREEVEAFSDAVDEVRSDVDRLEQRLQRLSEAGKLPQSSA